METTDVIDSKRITAWLNPETISCGKYGKVCNGVWIDREKDRIESDGHTCEILTRKNGNVTEKALFYK